MSDNALLTEGDVNFSAARLDWYDQLDENTRQRLAEDSGSFLHQSLSTPCLDVLESCEGIWLVDAAGRRYMDFHGNNVHQVGHRNPYVIQRLKAQLDTLPFSPRRYTNLPAIGLAKKLTGLLPAGLDRVLFAPGGTSAVSMALKLARVVTGRPGIVSFADSFHGASLDAIAAGGEAQFKKYMGPLHPDTVNIPAPAGNHNDDARSADALEEAILKNPDIGAFIAEPLRNTDVRIPSRAFWQRARDICDRHKVLLILDEIAIAFGRTGKLFAFEHYDIVPDILCLGKGLGAGIIPMAAMVTKSEYNLAPDVSLGHFTHEKSPLGSAAATAMLEYIEQQQLLEKVAQDESWVRQQLLLLKEKFPLIADVRGIGFLWAVQLGPSHPADPSHASEPGDRGNPINPSDPNHLVVPRNPSHPTAPSDPADPHTPLHPAAAAALTERVLYECLRQGLSFKVSQGNVLQLSPPLTITRDEWTAAIAIIGRAIDRLQPQ